MLAGIATAPVGVAHFGRLQWYGVAANAVAVPLTSVLVMPAGMLAALLMPLGLEAPALAVMGWGCEAVLVVAREVASWPGAATGARLIPPWGLACFAFGMLWLCLWRLRWRWLGVPLMALGLGSPALHRPPDLLVSGDARLVGFAADGVLWLQRQSGASNLVRDSWLRAHGVADARALPDRGRGRGRRHRLPRPRLHAARRGGRGGRGAAARWSGGTPLRPRGGDRLGRAGARALRRRPGGGSFSVWRHGPHAVWLDAAGARVVSDRDWRGARPWVPPPPVPRAREDLPPAAVE